MIVVEAIRDKNGNIVGVEEVPVTVKWIAKKIAKGIGYIVLVLATIVGGWLGLQWLAWYIINMLNDTISF